MAHPSIQKILHFWFGDIGDAALPTPERTRLWLNPDAKMDQQITELFEDDLKRAMKDEYSSWADTPQGRLALIILFDQFSRYIHRNTSKAFRQDDRALQLCIKGIRLEHDHALSLIERAFFYMPLLHAEDLHMQERSVIAYQMLSSLSLPELAVIFKEFLSFAIWHYESIKRFGRFPQRNSILGRESTTEELEFLQ